MRTAAIGLIVAAGAFAAAATAGAQPASNAARKAQAPVAKRPGLFFGAGQTATWLPKAALLPPAEEVEKLAQKLSSRLRNIDPFALQTFPREDALPLPIDDTFRTTPRVTLNQALQTLKVNGVNLQRKEILIGGRNAFEGDVIELSFRDEIFQAQLIEIAANQLLFRDLQRQETGVLPHSVVPNVDFQPMHKVASRIESRMSPLEAPEPRPR